MNNKTNNFNTYIINAILSQNEFGIKKVTDLKHVKGFSFFQGIYKQVDEIIKNRNFDALFNGTIKEDKSSEYLIIMSFRNESNKEFIVTIYYSDELWQDPEVVQIYPL